MLRSYVLTVEGDKHLILEKHGYIMRQLRDLQVKGLEVSIGFDERRRLGVEMLHLGKRGLSSGGKFMVEGIKEMRKMGDES